MRRVILLAGSVGRFCRLSLNDFVHGAPGSHMNLLYQRRLPAQLTPIWNLAWTKPPRLVMVNECARVFHVTTKVKLRHDADPLRRIR
jgi:hypothetical protein